MLNDMRDRLIELISDMENKLLRSYPYTTDEYRIASIADHLIENGAILPPCKVGDTLYEITSRNTISEYEVTAIRIELFNVFIDWKLTQGFVDKYISGMPAGEIGNSVFLTREDAEKALREREGE